MPTPYLSAAVSEQNSGDSATDFYCCLEHLDLLFQQLCLRKQIEPSDEMRGFLLSSQKDIAQRLQHPEGKPHWMSAKKAATYEGLDKKLKKLVADFSLTEYEYDILLLGLLPRISPHYSQLLAQLIRGNPEGMMNKDILLVLFSHRGATWCELIQAALHPAAPLVFFRLITWLPDSPSLRLFITHESVWHFLTSEQPLISYSPLVVRGLDAVPYGWRDTSLIRQLVRLWPEKSEQETFPLLVAESKDAEECEQAIANVLAKFDVSTYRLKAQWLDTLPEGERVSRFTDILRDIILYQSCLILVVTDVLSGWKDKGFPLLEKALQMVRLRVAVISESAASLTELPNVACVHLTFTQPSLKERATLLKHAIAPEVISTPELQVLCRQYSFTVNSLPNLVQEARCYQQVRDLHGKLTTDDLRQAMSKRSRKNFGKLAQRVTPRRTFDDLILPSDVMLQLKEMLAATRCRDTVIEKHFGAKLGDKIGISALFYGESGTGKTLAAEVIAHALSTDLIKVDLSTVVDKYIGETEKHLARIFDLAEADSGVLFFDEADALFGKRSETKDAHDRHANIEVSYLLQRLESYPGLVILATNNRGHLDQAFDRRFTFITRFTYPDAVLRQQLWQSVWPATLTLADDIDFKQLAEKTDLTGANIRNIALLAAWLASDKKSKIIQLCHIERAVQRELVKLGRLKF